MKHFGLAGMATRFKTFNVNVGVAGITARLKPLIQMLDHFNNYKVFSPVGITAKTKSFNINVKFWYYCME